jgi:outer membrane protein OmpA-like peptidoglycan-associated protein
MSKPILLLSAGLAALAGLAAPAAAQHSGVDAALFRPSIDTSGVFSLEGARLMPRRDLSWKMLVGYAQAPFQAPVPGIGEDGEDVILEYLATVDMAFGLSLTSKLAVGFSVAAYRTATGEGYGTRGRFYPDGSEASTGLISLRPLSNIDPSGGFEPQGLAGPLDVRVVAKYQALTRGDLAISIMGAAAVPFGEDEMFLGDRNFVLEPRLLLDYRLDRLRASKLVANLGVRLRERTVLEAYDARTETEEMATVVTDIGSEIIAGVGFTYEVGDRLVLGAEAVGFVPLPAALALGDCRRFDGSRCSSLRRDDYFAGGKAGDLAAYANAGVGFRTSPHLMVTLMGGAGLLGQRADDFRAVFGLVWAPLPKGVAELGRGDRDGDGIPDIADACPDEPEDFDGYQDDDGCPDLDNDGDGIPDALDACPDEPEDFDGYQDEDGCPERDNDGDGIPDVLDQCPNEPEDFDGFEDEDGCPDDDNDGDGFPDAIDQCPNEPETVNGYQDEDGCPDTVAATGPEELTDRISLRGARIEFQGNTANLTAASRTLLEQVAQLVRNRRLQLRVEVHVPLGTTSTSRVVQNRQRQQDKTLTDRRAAAIRQFLVSQGVSGNDVQAIGLGSSRPLGNNAPTDPGNERVDFIKIR